MTGGRRPSPVPGPRVRTNAVMVVEDNTAIREGLTSLLEEEGHQVIAVANGLEALEQLRWGNKPCLILLDLRMTVMTGWEFRAQQKQDPALENLTVVVTVTANGKLKINQDDITWEGLGPRIEQIFKERAQKVAFIKGDDAVLFAEVARAIDIMRSSGVDSVGLYTPKLESGE